jgi:hypothetical protein
MKNMLIITSMSRSFRRGPLSGLPRQRGTPPRPSPIKREREEQIIVPASKENGRACFNDGLDTRKEGQTGFLLERFAGGALPEIGTGPVY